MTDLFIFNSNQRASNYGIGTYVKQLTNSLLEYSNVNVYIVNYFSKNKEFSKVLVKPRYTIIDIPQPLILLNLNEIQNEKYLHIISGLLTEIVKGQNNVVFQANDYIALTIVKHLKGKFNYPLVSVVHSAQWQMIFNGNKKKFINTLNDRKSNEVVSKYLSKEKELYEMSDRIVSVTSYMKDFLVHFYNIDNDKISIAPNGFEENINPPPKNKGSLKRENGFLPEEKIIVFSGRLDKSKGYSFLLEAFAEVVKQYNNIRLLIIGDGEINTCFNYCKNIWGKVTFTGYVQKEQLFKFYQIADMGIIPSIYDHCPYSVLEMISFRIPLIMSNIEGLNEILTDNQCLFVNPEILQNGEISFNIKDIAEAILFIIQNKTTAIKMANRAYEVIDSKFSAQKMAKSMEELFYKTQF
jgi:glycosyltransferase